VLRNRTATAARARERKIPIVHMSTAVLFLKVSLRRMPTCTLGTIIYEVILAVTSMQVRRIRMFDEICQSYISDDGNIYIRSLAGCDEGFQKTGRKKGF